MIELIKTKVYAVRLKNGEELLECSSGGAFTAISNYFLRNNNSIISAIYDYQNNNTKFVLYSDVKKRNQARGSKYMQALPLNSFREAEEWLKQNTNNLLFVGMGCQAEGFRLFSEVKGLRDRVTIVGIVCHGVSSPKIWKEYAEKIGAFSNLNFRDKREGWRKPVSIITKDGEEKNIKEYMNIFYNRCALRPSCYECPYATTERHVDITIGDFWGIEKSKKYFEEGNGVSLILIHTNKGLEIWDNIKNQFVWMESNTTDCLQPNLIKPTEKSLLREQFWSDYEQGGIEFILNKYGKEPKVSLLRRLIGKIRKQFKKFYD